MSKIHRFCGDGEKFDWEEVPCEKYESPQARGVVRRWLIGEREGAFYFAMRYFEVDVGGWTVLHEHPHDHGVIVLKGRGKVLLENGEFEVKFGDVVYIPPGEKHQFKNTGNTPFGFICVIPNEKLL